MRQDRYVFVLYQLPLISANSRIFPGYWLLMHSVVILSSWIHRSIVSTVFLDNHLRHCRRYLFSPSGFGSIGSFVEDDDAEFPLAFPVLCHQVCVDDFAFGADEKVLVRKKQEQLIELLKKGGFRLRKWVNNALDPLSCNLDSADHGFATHKILQNEHILQSEH